MWTLCFGCSEADHNLLPQILQGISFSLSHCWLTARIWPTSYSTVYMQTQIYVYLVTAGCKSLKMLVFFIYLIYRFILLSNTIFTILLHCL